MRFLAIPMNEKLPTEALAIGRRGYNPKAPVRKRNGKYGSVHFKWI